MEQLQLLITQAQKGDLDAFGTIVTKFQDMAVGYAYSILGDFHLAQDAAQEAFISAFRDLKMLREPSAFPAWFRRLIFKQCNRLTRGRTLKTESLEIAMDAVADEVDPPAMLIPLKIHNFAHFGTDNRVTKVHPKRCYNESRLQINFFPFLLQLAL